MTTKKRKAAKKRTTAATKKSPAKRSPRAAFAVATNEKKSTAERAKAFAEAPLADDRVGSRVCRRR